MLFGQYGYHLHFLFLEQFCHLNRNDIATAGRDDECAICGDYVEISQDPFRESRCVFQEHRLPLSVGADDQVMECQGKFDDGIESWKRPVAWPHFFNHDAAMSRSEYMNHAARADSIRKPCRCLPDIFFLGSDCVQNATAFFQVTLTGCHFFFKFSIMQTPRRPMPLPYRRTARFSEGFVYPLVSIHISRGTRLGVS